MTPAAWSALAAVVARLVMVAAVDPDLTIDQRTRVGALEAAVAREEADGFPAARGPWDDEPPPEVNSWWEDDPHPAELSEAAVWLVADAACRLAAGERVKLQGALQALEAWAATVPDAR